MKGALYTVADLAIWMRCERSEVERLVREDGLPVVEFPGRQRPKWKFSPTQLCEWLNARTLGSAKPWTPDTLIQDIDRAVNGAREKAAKEAALAA